MKGKSAVIIGSGFSGLSAACFMAKAGWKVTLLEKHSQAGGRARQLKENGFTFDMGPSWYWMPDVFERFFNQFGKKVSDYYTLERLNPSYTVFWEDTEMPIPADFNELKSLFESVEKGSAEQLEKFVKEAAYKYNVGINKLVHKPSQSITEFLDWEVITGVLKLDVFTNMKKHVAKYFKNPKLQQLLEFPVLFLGALPQQIPALYSLMNYADLVGGTWYPQNGMYSIVDGMYKLAVELGVEFRFDEDLQEIVVDNGKAVQVKTQHSTFNIQNNEVVISSADYHFTETKLLQPQYQSYNKKYWNSRVMAPSCLLYYIGLNKKLQNITHHSLFFDTDFGVHGKEIYKTKEFPSNPLFYVCTPSVTDETVAPKGFENLFFLIPIASGLENDTEELRKKYFDIIVKRFEDRVGEQITDNVIYYKSYATSNFIDDYNSFKGNAYGLANTLLQTSILKPNCRSKKVSNLFYTGQLTVPGPGVPPSLISGEVVANLINKLF
ncbi:MAG: phytoene desaturase family protein [Bacteroidetes bacterium]|nr:phytoene desaturase family protein [Bacteroidota bacterium]